MDEGGKRVTRKYRINVLDKRTRFPIISITTNNDNSLLYNTTAVQFIIENSRRMSGILCALSKRELNIK